MTLVGAVIPATGRYAVQGAQLRAGLELWALRRAVQALQANDDATRGVSKPGGRDATGPRTTTTPRRTAEPR